MTHYTFENWNAARDQVYLPDRSRAADGIEVLEHTEDGERAAFLSVFAAVARRFGMSDGKVLS